MERMGPADARTYWMSKVIPSDQFLLYAFEYQDVPLGDLADGLRRRAATIPDLNLRVLDIPGSLDRPIWVEDSADDEQIVVHHDVLSWPECLVKLGMVMADQLQPARHAWRIHLFGPVPDSPRGRGVVAVLQVCHALGDGRRSSEIARQLFDPQEPPPGRRSPMASRLPSRAVAAGVAATGVVALPIRVGRMFWLGARAYRTVRDRPPTRAPGYPTTALNNPPGPDRTLRVLVVDRNTFESCATVTVGALTAISVALERYLDLRGASAGAELTIGRSRPSTSRNNFRNAGIDLHVEVDDLAQRSRAIADEIVCARALDDEPARTAQRRADDAVPAILTHWGTQQFDISARPDRVTGVTVVSSVNRGNADLRLGGGRVLFTSGFPALSPAQGLTHGVHGIGDTVAISLTTSPRILPDVDAYLGYLRDGIEAVRAIDQESDSSPRE
ncbi:WS/DGAT domain-containing protein [Gordonia sp. LSe1-13]|uniref:WS/DGAT domain-containing protein n=1 Tax=Gordonia sesuvii TaxID=3116777 RepID=A0ABU7MI58_9ACTN|nr:WS/DGAT domain-containing protein [Gordonia sp. LSe1-13]